MPVRNIKSIPVYAWIPPRNDPIYKFEIIRNDGTIDDVTDYLLNGEVFDGVTDTVGTFNLTIDNSADQWTNKYSGGETFNFYCDYSTVASTLTFRGKIEKISPQDMDIQISGRTNSADLLQIFITKSYSDTETSIILKELLTEYASQFTQNNIQTSSTNITINWYQKNLLECITELCQNANFDFYIDCNLDTHYFSSGSVNNQTDCIVHDINLLEVLDNQNDSSQVINSVTVYGANIGGLPLIYTSTDREEGELLKELIIHDENISTMIQCQERADYELNKKNSNFLAKEIRSKGLASIQPGENIRISAPFSNIPPNYYKIKSYKHSFGNFMETSINADNELRKIFNVVKDRISNEQAFKANPNPNDMKYSWNFDFSVNSGSHTNTTIDTDRHILKLATGSSGSWESDSLELSDNVSVVELRLLGDKLSDVGSYISIDGGITWIPTNFIGKRTIAAGNNLKIKIDINSSTSQITGAVLLYKL